MATTDAILSALLSHRARLSKLGVVHAGVFGSTVRGQAHPDSDIDVLVVLEPNERRTVFDLVGIEHAVAEVVPGPLDVAVADQLKPAIRELVLADAVMAF